ncbi:hypothetical protein ACFW04_014001 [Cataglyphis niger]
MSERANIDAMNASRVNVLWATVNRHTDAVSKLLLSSKETLEKREIIESAFRVCREAFMEMSTVLISLIDERLTNCTAIDIKKVVVKVVVVLDDFNKKTISNVRNNIILRELQVRKANRMRRLLVLRDLRYVSRWVRRWRCLTPLVLLWCRVRIRGINMFSQVTKDILCKVLKPVDCGVKVRRISYARDNGIRIEAFSPNIEKKAHSGLARAGLTVRENLKLNPKLIVHGIPADMSAEEIEDELLAQNFSDVSANDVKIVYIFTPKQDRRITSCILDVTLAVRRILLGSGRIYLRYSACSFADHVRIVQCYRCLSFGHIAKDCKNKPSCRYCAGAYKMKECKNRDQLPKSLNCECHHVSHGNLAHSAIDAAKCSILGRRVRDKIANTNHE